MTTADERDRAYLQAAQDEVAHGHHLNASLLAWHAEQQGASVDWMTHRIAVVTFPDRRLLLDSCVAHESALGSAIATSKRLTKAALEKHGVPTPRMAVAATEDDAVSLVEEFGFSVVLKPASGRRGHGITVNVRDEQDVREAFRFAAEHDEDEEVLVEQYIDTEDEFRCLASPDECVAVIRRLLPNVTGDGVSTIRELIEAKNMRRREDVVHRFALPIDDVLIHYLKRQRLSLEHVPADGEYVVVRDVGGLSGGGDSEEYSDRADPEVADVAARAVAAIPGLRWGGVDMVTERGTGRPFAIEINTNAAFGAACFPTRGEPKDAAARIWELKLEATAPDHAPSDATLTLLTEPTGLPLGHRESDDDHEGPQTGQTMEEVFTAWVCSDGGTVERLGGGVLRVRTGDASERLLTNSLLSDADPFVGRRVARLHCNVRRLLALADVPRPRGRNVTGRRQAAEYLGSESGPVTAVPRDGTWRGPATVVAEASDVADTLTFPGTWFVQLSAEGLPLRVFARADGAVAVSTPDPAVTVDEQILEVATETAVRAVRAVPELRWAVVDVLIRPERIAAGRANPVVVEGLSHTPHFAATERLIAGSLDDLFAWILTSQHVDGA